MLLSSIQPPSGSSFRSSPAMPAQPRLPATPLKAVPPLGAAFPVYLVEPDRASRIDMSRALSAAGFQMRPFRSREDFSEALPELDPGAVVIDIADVLPKFPGLRADGGEGALIYPTILTFCDLSADEAIAAVRLGAVDLLRRPTAADAILDGLKRAESKVRLMTQQIAAQAAAELVTSLTRRERHVMDCIMRGLSNKEMARVLGVSPRTVEMHRARLHRRLKVSTLAELLAIAWQARSCLA